MTCVHDPQLRGRTRFLSAVSFRRCVFRLSTALSASVMTSLRKRMQAREPEQRL